MFLLNTNSVLMSVLGGACFKKIIDRSLLFPLFIETILFVKIATLIQYLAHSVYLGNSSYEVDFFFEWFQLATSFLQNNTVI